jgi:hypothetical protein
MSSKNKNRNNRGAQPAVSSKPAMPQAAAPSDPEQEIRDALADSRAVAPPVRPGSFRIIPIDSPPPGADLPAFWEMVKEVKVNYAAAAQRTAERETALAQSAEALESERAKLLEAQDKLAQDRARHDERETDYRRRAELLEPRERTLAAKDSALASQESALKARELNAEAGFAAQRKASLAALDDSAASLRAELAQTEQVIAAERTAWLRDRQAESERLRAEIERAVREREASLDEREGQLQERQSELAKLARRLQRQEQAIEEDCAAIDERVGQRMARESEAFERQNKTLQDRLEQARADRDASETKLREREDSDRRLGQRTPEQTLAELDRLRAENDRLETELARRPDAQAAERLRALETERADWQGERIALQRKASEAEQRLAKQQIAVTELEMLRDQKSAAESRVAVLQKARDELRTEVEQLIERDDAKVPFRACSAMDADANYQEPGETNADIGDLSALVDELQQRIAHDPQNPKQPLYYSKSDLRCFLGGLAMGRLILLQGISGTGKTSLPRAFARAVGTQFKDNDNLIEVQAGWRDPQDLIGHYNAFEKKFYEQKFLRALYRAGTPQWRDAIHVVVLDEMNLSHPEQYFSDLLSALEQPFERRFIELYTSALPQAPSLFVDGRRLKIAENVWFVGTANHDETTKDFADKTYDRSLVMEFAHQPQAFAVQAQPARLKPLSYKALGKAFAAAQKDHAAVADRVASFLDTELRDPLGRDFGIGWGPRLAHQLKRFCPVVKAAGGSVGEAADHILALRLLRKLKNRHDNRQDRLERLYERIEGAWPKLDAAARPEKSLAILDGELARLGVGGGEGE